MSAPEVRIGRLNHVGVATPSIETALGLYVDTLGAFMARAPFELPEHGVRVCFVSLANSEIELLEPLGEASPIAAFLARNPLGGQHHICFEVAQLSLAATALERKGLRILGAPRIGAHGAPVIFVQPKDMGGVLIELMEVRP